MTVGKARKFSDEHRLAIEKATLDDGLSAAEAARRAAAGELLGAGRFQISEQRAREFRNEGRARREMARYADSEGDKLGLSRAIVEDMLHDRLMVLRQRQLKRTDRAIPDLIELRDLVGDLARLERESTRMKVAKTAPSKQDEPDTDSDPAAEERRRLEDRLNAEQNSTPRTRRTMETATNSNHRTDTPATQTGGARRAV